MYHDLHGLKEVSDAVSGNVPEEPVVNRNNGQLFEKRLVTKHVKVQTPSCFLSSDHRNLPRTMFAHDDLYGPEGKVAPAGDRKGSHHTGAPGAG